MVDAFTKLHQARSRDERAAVLAALKELVAELVKTADGRWYRQVLEEIPDAEWRAFHFELMNALIVPTPPSYDPQTRPPSGLRHIAKKQDLLAEEYRKRAQLDAAKRVERLARMDVPGVTAPSSPARKTAQPPSG